MPNHGEALLLPFRDVGELLEAVRPQMDELLQKMQKQIRPVHHNSPSSPPPALLLQISNYGAKKAEKYELLQKIMPLFTPARRDAEFVKSVASVYKDISDDCYEWGVSTDTDTILRQLLSPCSVELCLFSDVDEDLERVPPAHQHHQQIINEVPVTCLPPEPPCSPENSLRPLWLSRWLLSVPAYAPSDVAKEIAIDTAILFSTAPLITGDRAVFDEGPVLYKIDEAIETLNEFKVLRCKNPPSLFENPHFRSVFTYMTSSIPHVRISQALRFLRMADQSSHAESLIVLATAALESICPLKAGIAKGLENCVCILYPPAERAEKRNLLRKLYKERCNIVHGGVANISEEFQNETLLFVADVIRERCEFSMILNNLHDEPLPKILGLYLSPSDEFANGVREYCDSDTESRLLRQVQRDKDAMQS